ncbi:MAG: DUF4442 domain-containing protein [Bdellovibrionota bacterium]
MASGTKFERSLEGLLEKLPGLAEQLKALARNPRSLGAKIEIHSPWLSRHFLGAASNFVEPFLVGMGLKVENLGEEIIEVSLPGHWRNQGEGGIVHNGALSSLGEFASRLYWEHHLDLRGPELFAKHVDLRSLTRARGDLRGVFRWSVASREEIQLRLRAGGEADANVTVSVYDASEKLVAEVDVEWSFTRQLSLGSGQGT